jgi:hypothetical protein
MNVDFTDIWLAVRATQLGPKWHPLTATLIGSWKLFGERLEVLFGSNGKGKPRLLVRSPNVFRGLKSIQIIERTQCDRYGIGVAFPLDENLAAAARTKLADEVIARRKFSQHPGDSHQVPGKKSSNKKGRTRQPLAILAMAYPHIDRRTGHHVFYGPAKAAAGSGVTGNVSNKRFVYSVHDIHLNATAPQFQTARYVC